VNLYTGFDRVKQMNSLDELAQDIASYSGVTDPMDADLAVNKWLEGEELPHWFSQHDEGLLTERVAEHLAR